MVSSFVIYDLMFLAIFSVALGIFFYKRKANFKIEGIAYLYRTKLGIKFIEWTSKKFPKTLRRMQYIVIASGYVLMSAMIYLLVKFSLLYLSSPIAAKALKVPVIIPLVPYLPELFNLDFLPPFYFTYWIIILAIIAIPHEFAHGIFARLKKIKIHSTGFGFLRFFKLPTPFLLAFVEQDEKDMEKASKRDQLAVLAAGTFANVIFTVIFGIIFWLFFISAFTPAGVIFTSYAEDAIPLSAIEKVNGIAVASPSEIPSILNLDEKAVNIEIQNFSFYASPLSVKNAVEGGLQNLVVTLDSPAYRAELSGAITEIDGEKITNYGKLREIIYNRSPGESITITTLQSENQEKVQTVELGNFRGRAFLGIGVRELPLNGVLGWLYQGIANIKDPYVYYESSLGDLGWFIYHMLWWTVLIGISVALFNMLPFGLLDGGRFFYLTVWGITRNKKAGEVAFKVSNYIGLLLLVALMLKWIFIVPSFF